MRGIMHIVSAAVLSVAACSGSTGPESAPAVLYQAAGCRPQSRMKAAAGCFSYQFDDVLMVEFCAEGNCCPNSDRFAMSAEIRKDTIFVTVEDTAANLCRCTCAYSLHAAFRDLERDSYVFVSMRGDGSVFLSERVERK